VSLCFSHALSNYVAPYVSGEFHSLSMVQRTSNLLFDLMIFCHNTWGGTANYLRFTWKHSYFKGNWRSVLTGLYVCTFFPMSL